MDVVFSGWQLKTSGSSSPWAGSAVGDNRVLTAGLGQLQIPERLKVQPEEPHFGETPCSFPREDEAFNITL